jgi:hypothetical protein
MKSVKVTSKAPRQTVKSGEVPMPKISQIKGKGMNAGGSPNSLKKLFPKSKNSTPKYPKAPEFSKGGKVSKPC